MGTHFQNKEAEAELRRQRRNATTTSVIVAMLSVILCGLILALVILPSLSVSQTVLVSYQAKATEDEPIDPKRMETTVQRQPSAPSSSMAKVVASTAPSPVSVPVPDSPVEPSLNFGDGDDFGAGWGNGDGIGGGGTSFFGQSVRAERIAYVIDFSSSMKSNGREALMRKEMKRSLDELSHGTRYAIVFFSCIAWVAGDEVNLNRQGGRAEVKAAGGRNYTWKNQGGAKGWKPEGRKQEVSWLTASLDQLKKSKSIMAKAPLSSGTAWDNPIEMLLDMRDPPQVICFMTDGVASGSKAWARDLAAKAKKKGVQINCVAMMEPKAHDDLNELAKRTGGSFSIVMKDGKHKRVR